ncbi:MAG: tripartite ATP-independent transporter DctM subunit [Kiritimatiellia bacterium]|jgi:tripartite ATP-independent transporter DctM subunit
MDPQMMAPIMFGTVLIFIFCGYPVAFALGGTSIIFAAIGVGMDFFDFNFLNSMPNRIFGIMSNGVLLAIPYFIFMGTMLEKSKLAEDLLQTIGQLFGPIRGGLAMAVVFVGALLAAATGVVGASVVAMGMISLPVMLRYGYQKELATGVIAASGTLGQIIPPSVVLIVLADQLGCSVSDLFKGALVPGVMLATCFALYVGILAAVKPELAPALPLSERTMTKKVLIRRVLLVMLPPLVLILLVLGSIFTGFATPTDAGAFGAIGAMGLAAANRRLNKLAIMETTEATSRLTCMVIFLLIGSTAFALVFRKFGGDLWIEDILTNMPGGLIGALIVANLTIFILGFFIDFFEIAFIVVPLLGPVFINEFADEFQALYNISPEMIPIWFGIMVAMNLQTSFLTPPFGFSLFYLKGVCPPEVKTTQIYRGVLPFIAIQVVALIVVIVFPQTVLWLTN